MQGWRSEMVRFSKLTFPGLHLDDLLHLCELCLIMRTANFVHVKSIFITGTSSNVVIVDPDGQHFAPGLCSRLAV